MLPAGADYLRTKEGKSYFVNRRLVRPEPKDQAGGICLEFGYM